MLTNPFESDLTCLRRMCSFLVAQFRADIGLCGEGLEDIWFHPPVFSIWASADVLDALTDAVKLIKESSADDLDLAPKVEGLDSAFRNTLTELIKDLERDRTARCNHARDQLGAGPINNIPRVLDGVLLDLHRGLPFPRSITAGDTQRGGYPYWSDFQLFSSGAVYRYLRKRFAKGYPPDAAALHEWVNRSLPCYLWTADWNCLRAGTLGQDLPAAADEHALIKALGDGFNCYATPLRPFLHYGTFPPLSGRVGQSLADMFLDEQLAGCMVAAGPDRVGWTITPPKLLSGAADLLASAVALEVLAPALVDQLLAQSSKADRTRTTTALKSAIDDLAGQVQASAGYLCSVERSLGELTRMVLAVVFAADTLSSANLPQPSPPDLVTLVNHLDKTAHHLYEWLLMRCLDLMIRRQAFPFEVSPHLIVSDCELSHWPGIDIGMTATALIAGRQYTQVGDLRSKLRGSYGLSDDACAYLLPEEQGRLAVGCPLIATLIAQIKRQVVGAYNEHMVRDAVLRRHVRLRGNLNDLQGAFVSSTSNLDSDSPPTIYTWSTAQALRALTLWQKDLPAEQHQLAAAQDTLANVQQRVREETRARNIFNPKGLAVSLIPGSIVAFLAYLAAVCFTSYKARPPKPTDAQYGYDIGFGAGALNASLFWMIWLCYILRARAKALCAELLPHDPKTSRLIIGEVAIMPIFMFFLFAAAFSISIFSEPPSYTIGLSKFVLKTLLVLVTLVGVILAPWIGVIVYWVLALVMGSLEMFPKRGLRTQVVMRGLWVAWMLLFSDHSNRQAAILALSRDLKESEVNVTA